MTEEQQVRAGTPDGSRCAVKLHSEQIARARRHTERRRLFGTGNWMEDDSRRPVKLADPATAQEVYDAIDLYRRERPSRWNTTSRKRRPSAAPTPAAAEELLGDDVAAAADASPPKSVFASLRYVTGHHRGCAAHAVA